MFGVRWLWSAVLIIRCGRFCQEHTEEIKIRFWIIGDPAVLLHVFGGFLFPDAERSRNCVAGDCRTSYCLKRGTPERIAKSGPRWWRRIGDYSPRAFSRNHPPPTEHSGGSRMRTTSRKDHRTRRTERPARSTGFYTGGRCASSLTNCQ